ncbi:hypothetical protein OG613_47540 (plasmid) [Streptomyces sp. NBC_00015]
MYKRRSPLAGEARAPSLSQAAAMAAELVGIGIYGPAAATALVP